MPQAPLQRLPEILFEIGKAITGEGELDTLLGRISELICALVDADACSIALLDSQGTRLWTKAAHGLPKGRIAQISFDVGEGVAGWVVKHCQAARIDDVSTDARFIEFPNSKTKICSMACVPLVAYTEPVGALTATSAKRARFSQDVIDVLGFVARTIALDIENIRLRRLAVTDPLTGAYNREFLHTRLPLELAQSRTGNQPLSVAMIDIDYFKSVNDSYGHDIGDLVLAEVARRLRQSIRTNDLLVRYGGEEFLIVLPHADQQRAHEIAERMRATMQLEPICAGAHRVEIRISVGIAEHQSGPDEGTPAAQALLIRRADTALYSAKGRGRNRVEVAP